MGQILLRRASPADIAALEQLIARSARGLSTGFYSAAELDAVSGEVFGVDSQLVADGTYFMLEADGVAVACGGWGMRSTGCGGDRSKSRLHGAPERLLDAAAEAAKIRAFFVEPSRARQGLASQLMAQCVLEAAAAGFTALELVATLPGVPLYARLGFEEVERYDLMLAVPVPVVLMRRTL